MFHDPIVNQYECETYFVGALAEAVMIHSGGGKGSLYIKISKWSKEDDEINAMIFVNLIYNVNVVEENAKKSK